MLGCWLFIEITLLSDWSIRRFAHFKDVSHCNTSLKHSIQKIFCYWHFYSVNEVSRFPRENKQKNNFEKTALSSLCMMQTHQKFHQVDLSSQLKCLTPSIWQILIAYACMNLKSRRLLPTLNPAKLRWPCTACSFDKIPNLNFGKKSIVPQKYQSRFFVENLADLV